ncbi:MAG TPA: HAD family hydrolase [bacterium]|nr:HAD family hydrolase [bacterium]
MTKLEPPLSWFSVRKKEMRLTQVVIFDLDGTLLDTIGDLADAANAVLSEHGFPQHSEAEYMRMVGAGIRELVRAMLPASVDTSDVTYFVDRMETEYRECWNRRTRPYPGISEMLDDLTGARCRLSVLSNKPHAFTEQMVRGMLQPWRFDPVWGASADRPRKPDPGTALMIARHHGSPPDRCIFVGDSEPDIRTAHRAGMISVGVTWGFRQREQLAKEKPDYMIDHPGELAGIIDRMK